MLYLNCHNQSGAYHPHPRQQAQGGEGTCPTSQWTTASEWSISGYLTLKLSSLVAETVKHLSAIQETQVRSLGWEDPLEKEMAAHFSILAWKIPRTAEPGRLLSMGLQRIRHDWATSLLLSILKLGLQYYLLMLHSICQQIWKTQQWPQDWKRSVFIPIPKNVQTTAHCTHLTCYQSNA